jgi:hypothetical protein
MARSVLYGLDVPAAHPRLEACPSIPQCNIGLSKRLASANKQRVLKKATNGEQAFKEPYR